MSKRMLVWQSGLAGLQVFAGGTVLTELVDARFVGLLILAVAAAQSATAFYQRGLGLPVPRGVDGR